MKFTGKVPGEISRLFNSKGDTFEKKLENFIEIRTNELAVLFSNFWDSCQEKKQRLLQAIFYMDTDLFAKYEPKPFIDKQLMISEPGPNKTYKILSQFPLCNVVLKPYLKDAVVKSDFFDSRIQELKKELAKADLNESVRGRYYEEFILTCFQNFHHKKEKLQIFYWSQFDLKDQKEENKVTLIFYFFI